MCWESSDPGSRSTKYHCRSYGRFPFVWIVKIHLGFTNRCMRHVKIRICIVLLREDPIHRTNPRVCLFAPAIHSDVTVCTEDTRVILVRFSVSIAPFLSTNRRSIDGFQNFESIISMGFRRSIGQTPRPIEEIDTVRCNGRMRDLLPVPRSFLRLRANASSEPVCVSFASPAEDGWTLP